MVAMPPRPETPTTFGVNLRRLRIEAEMTQRELAEASRVRQPTISSLETGRSGSRNGPQARTVTKLCQALGCKPSELLDAADGLLPRDAEVIEWVRGKGGVSRPRRIPAG
jgi:transcriptional regulator with XRE-family HTH domain